MATGTYITLGRINLALDSSTVTFQGIDQSYSDLVLVMVGSASPNQIKSINIEFNDDSASSYSFVRMLADFGGGIGTSSGSTGTVGTFVNSQHQLICNIMDYSSTTKHKSWLSRSNSAETQAFSGIYASNSAITSLSISPVDVDFAAGTIIELHAIDG